MWWWGRLSGTGIEEYWKQGGRCLGDEESEEYRTLPWLGTGFFLFFFRVAVIPRDRPIESYGFDIFPEDSSVKLDPKSPKVLARREMWDTTGRHGSVVGRSPPTSLTTYNISSTLLLSRAVNIWILTAVVVEYSKRR